MRAATESASIVVLAVALVAGTAVTVAADPTPNTGPTTGGTVVTDSTSFSPIEFTQVEAGSSHSVALGKDGNWYAWGENGSGQLGDGTTTDRTTPVVVDVPTGVAFTQIDVGVGHAVALGDDGNWYAWGENGYGQLGDGTTTDRTTPVVVDVPSGLTFTQIEAGLQHTVALGDDGNAYAWGNNSQGQLGDGTTTASASPVLVEMPSDVTFTQIEVGNVHAAALGDDGNTYAWGGNNSNSLGDGSRAPYRTTPVRVNAPADVTFTQLNTGALHTMALSDDGTWYAWGSNSQGQLGDGTTTERLSPVLVNVPSGVTFTQIVPGGHYSVALGDDDNTYAWGDNSSGQLGVGQLGGGSIASPTPVVVDVPSGVTFTQVAARWKHSVALGDDGNTYSWGENRSGQLGDGTTTQRDTPVLVKAPPTLTEVLFGSIAGTNLSQSGATYTVETPAGVCGVVDVTEKYSNDETVVHENAFTFGSAPVVNLQPVKPDAVENGDTVTISAGALGDPTPGVKWQSAPGSSGPWSDIPGATSDTLTLPVEDEQYVRAVFDNCFNTAATSAVPVSLLDTFEVLVQKTGEDTTGAIVPMDGSAWTAFDAATGGNEVATMTGAVDNDSAPITGLFTTELVPGEYWLEETKALEGFALLAERVKFTVATDGEVTLDAGVSANIAVSSTSETLTKTGQFTQISPGVEHTVALDDDGNAYAWGTNSQGQLGDGTTSQSTSPVMVDMPSGVTFTQAAAGYLHTVALAEDGNAYAWGLSPYGQLGLGATVESPTPAMVEMPSGVTFTQVDAGHFHTVALGDDGNTYAWGYNNYGQLGTGTTPQNTTPVAVEMPSGVTFTQVAAGMFHTVALGDDGNTYAWGENRNGQLGDGTTSQNATPVMVDMPSGVTFTQVDAGHSYTAALGDDGNTYAWGYNNVGQLGDGTTTDRTTPVVVDMPSGVTFTQIRLGASHTLALGDDGNTYAWGVNRNGQLGDGTNEDRTTPVVVDTPSGVTFTQIDTGASFTAAVGDDGNVYTWGSNTRGQLGDGTTTQRDSPALVEAPERSWTVMTSTVSVRDVPVFTMPATGTARYDWVALVGAITLLAAGLVMGAARHRI
ncbi:SpaA isopeptide-forming pilin-related protein [Demequina sp.]|uniref:RCC1 domain-containing protein n=1 Tax=Demequina sp. TaxID=2050685 RepID=UPI003A84E2F6